MMEPNPQILKSF